MVDFAGKSPTEKLPEFRVQRRFDDLVAIVVSMPCQSVLEPEVSSALRNAPASRWPWVTWRTFTGARWQCLDSQL